MAVSTWLAFFAASWLISLSPGAGAISCMAAGMRHGYRKAAWNIAGLQLGVLLILVIVAAGLGAILTASATAFAIVKWLGVAYLVWLGITQWRASATPIAAGNGTRPEEASPRALLLRGFMVNATNPKGIVFMLAVLPQFIDPARPQLVQYAICGGTLFFTDLVVMNGYTGLGPRCCALCAIRRTSAG